MENILGQLDNQEDENSETFQKNSPSASSMLVFQTVQLCTATALPLQVCNADLCHQNYHGILVIILVILVSQTFLCNFKNFQDKMLFLQRLSAKSNRTIKTLKF